MTEIKPTGSGRNRTGTRRSHAAAVEVTPETLQAITSSTDSRRALVLSQETLASLWSSKVLSDEQRRERGEAVVAALKAIAPMDELEGMLAGQMVATHSAAMDCFRRAMLESRTFEGREANLKHAEKLLTVYTRQMEALDKHRGKGQQKITVEHVTVNEGGQAIVGNVTGAASAAAPGNLAGDSAHPALAHDPASLAPQIDLASSAESRRKARAKKS